MVIVWLYLLFSLPCFLFSAEFTATVSKNELGKGEAFILNLTLKDASAKTSPSVEVLNHNFIIYSQQQSSSTIINNGKVTSSQIWTLNLVPQIVGEVQIPAIGIETTEGTLFSNPISLKIQEGKSENKTEEDVFLEAKSSNLHPYKNEPFFLTITLTSKKSLNNLQAAKFNIDDAIVELAENPMIKEKLMNGLKVGTVEFKYLITPLKAGLLKIPPLTIQGSIPQKRNSHHSFDDPFNYFSSLSGFANLQPFALSTNEQTIEIRPPIHNVTPWLPAQLLEIQEKSDIVEKIKEGEIFTRDFVITAEGIHSSQLPTLENMLANGNQFKVYADKPELKDEIVNNILKSSRIEKYTIIPQTSGKLTLPAISLEWWDTITDQRKTLQITERTLEIVPEESLTLNEKENAPFSTEIEKTNNFSTGSLTSSDFGKIPVSIYIVIGILVASLVFAIGGIIFLLQKINRLQKTRSTQKTPNTDNFFTRNFIREKKLLTKNSSEKLDELNPT